jgi:hypothetical protein
MGANTWWRKNIQEFHQASKQLISKAILFLPVQEWYQLPLIHTKQCYRWQLDCIAWRSHQKNGTDVKLRTQLPRFLCVQENGHMWIYSNSILCCQKTVQTEVVHFKFLVYLYR